MFRNAQKKIQEKLRKEFGKLPTEYEMERMRERLSYIELYHKEITGGCGEKGIDEITWNDLEMDQVFQRINYTKSYMGEQVLYHKLHDTDSTGPCHEELEKQIDFYTENETERIRIEEKLCAIGKREEDYYMPSFLMNAELWTIRGGAGLHILQLLLAICLAGAVWTEKPVFVIGLIIVAGINLMVYVITKQKYEVFLYSLGSLKQLLNLCEMMSAEAAYRGTLVPEEICDTVGNLKGLSRKIVGWQGRKSRAIAGDMLYLLQDYLFGITLWDIALFNHIVKHINQKQEQIMRLYKFAGGVDMGISIASFRKSVTFFCTPQIGSTDVIKADALVHPLLMNAVENDFELSGGALITGANASGKSTFMKALAINTILAQTIHTCTARAFYMPKLRIMTSMSLRDDILRGESYYIREAKRIRNMTEAVHGTERVLLVIDEILKGTNTEERLAASAAILNYFSGTDDFVVAATHDMELIYDLSGKYENYYFDSKITEDNILFEYRIHKGNGGNSNAIAVLSMLGYPQSIVEEAEQRVRKSARKDAEEGGYENRRSSRADRAEY